MPFSVALHGEELGAELGILFGQRGILFREFEVIPPLLLLAFDPGGQASGRPDPAGPSAPVVPHEHTEGHPQQEQEGQEKGVALEEEPEVAHR